MPSIAAIERVLWFLSLAGHAALLARLIGTKLCQIYRVFSWYLALVLCRAVVLVSFDPKSNPYYWIFLFSLPVFWCAYAAVLVELYRIILRSHPGPARIGRYLMVGALLMSVLASVMLAVPSFSTTHNPDRIMIYCTVAKRVVDAAMACFIVLMSAFLIWFPVTLTRNILIYFCGWGLSFLAGAALALYPAATGRRIDPVVNALLNTIDCACIYGWLFGIRSAGELIFYTLGHRWNPADRSRLREQLRAVDQLLGESQPRPY